MLHPDGCSWIEVAQPFNQVTYGSNTDTYCRQALLDRDRAMILKVRLTFWNPCRAAVHALSRPLTDKAETTEHTSGLHGGEGPPVPSCCLR